MVLHSLLYLAFLSAAVVVYYAVPWKARWMPVLAASTVFYLTWRVDGAVVLFGLIAAQYVLAVRMDRQVPGTSRRWYLLAALGLGFGSLAYFKYATGLRQSLATFVAAFLGRSVDPGVSWFVPIGISFFTLQSAGYLLDVYFGRRKAERHLGVFAAFVCFFPTVLSGPIERASHLLPQLGREQRIRLTYANISQGVKFIIWGLFLKLVIADRSAIYVDAVFGNADRHGGITCLVATVFYSFQLYCDFAGYSSVAIGSAKLLGVDVLQNFNRPYLAISVREFWKRWHMSLSNWLRDYVFLPLAYALSRRFTGDTVASFRVDRVLYIAAIFPTFALCGVWHGPNATFLVWGCLHGLYLAIENNVRIRPRWKLLHMARTYVLILVSWVFFRAASVDGALDILLKIASAPGRLFVPEGPDVVAPLYAVGGIAFLVAVEVKQEFFPAGPSFFAHRNELVRLLAYGVLVALIIATGVFDGGQFIYAQF